MVSTVIFFPQDIQVFLTKHALHKVPGQQYTKLSYH